MSFLARSQAAPATRSPLNSNPLFLLSLVALCALASFAVYELNSAEFVSLKARPRPDPDIVLERDILSEFRTSFVPPQEELAVQRGYRTKRYAEEAAEDGWVSGDGEYLMLRAKRSFALDSNDGVPILDNDKAKSTSRSTTTEGEDALEDASDSSHDDEDQYYDVVKSVNGEEARPAGAAPGERGPLDDVVDELRAQPELEDGEAAQGTGFHFQDSERDKAGGMPAFWNGAGDADSVRATQAEVMKRYIDSSVDPCEDFYQYACGNWAARNPIPADKAGYDTFEILRENLDGVLGDLLTLKENEQMPSVYPGPKLELDHNGLIDTATAVPNDATSAQLQLETDPYSDEPIDYTIQYDNGDEIRKRKRREGLQSRKRRIKRENIDMIIEGSRQEQISTDNIGDPAKGDATLKAKYLYKSCMNHEILARRGSQPLLDLLQMLGGWPVLQPEWNASNFDWLDLIARLRLYNNDILISEWVGPDIKNSDEFVIQFDQTSLGLPTRDYFLSPANRVYLEAYRLYLVKTACLLGATRAAADRAADRLVAFETKLAAITSAPEERRNVSELYRRLSVAELAALVPAVDWSRYLSVVLARTPDPQQSVVIFALDYVKQLVALLERTDPRTVSNYLLWRFVRHRVNNLDDRFQRVKQQFYFTLFGREQAPPRWKACVGQVNSNMGMALGAMFVRARFDGRSKRDTTAMTRDIQSAFRAGLRATAWIDGGTRRLAVEKLDAITLRIGYPDYILDAEELNGRYREVHIHPDKYFENTLNILQHLTKVEQARLGQPVNKTVWNTAPAVVNAYYSRNKNQITFPAGILQPPFYHRAFPRSLNYGGIGVVIGHEMTHGFDDKGRLFDKRGNLRRWWGERAVDAFHRRAQCLVDQYSHFVVKEVGMNVDGVNTQGENIADNGGIKQAFHSYRQWVERHGARRETLPGLNATHYQLFFLNFAQVWCGAMRPEATRNKLKTAVHSPGRFRVLGTLCNSAEFAREYACPPGAPMNPLRKCSVW